MRLKGDPLRPPIDRASIKTGSIPPIGECRISSRSRRRFVASAIVPNRAWPIRGLRSGFPLKRTLRVAFPDFCEPWPRPVRPAVRVASS